MNSGGKVGITGRRVTVLLLIFRSSQVMVVGRAPASGRTRGALLRSVDQIPDFDSQRLRELGERAEARVLTLGFNHGQIHPGDSRSRCKILLGHLPVLAQLSESHR